MNFSPTCRQKPERQCRTTSYCQRNSIFHGQKNNCNIHIFDRAKSGFVRAKKYLAGHHDRRPAVRYFEPWNFQTAFRYKFVSLKLFLIYIYIFYIKQVRKQCLICTLFFLLIDAPLTTNELSKKEISYNVRRKKEGINIKYLKTCSIDGA